LLLENSPPTINTTLCAGRNVAVCPRRAVIIEPVTVNAPAPEFAAGSKSSADAEEIWFTSRPPAIKTFPSASVVAL
jgi:hypothetical protein